MAGINPDYKSKYARSIWQQYEENVIAAAYTATAAASTAIFVRGWRYGLSLTFSPIFRTRSTW